MLTSNGDLQIVQVHKTDSGTYVCVADNGIGEPVQREIKLDIAGKFGLFGESRFFAIISLLQFFHYNFLLSIINRHKYLLFYTSYTNYSFSILSHF